MNKWRIVAFVAVLALSFAFATGAYATTVALDMPDGAYLASTTKIDISGLTLGASYGSITDGVLTASFSNDLVKEGPVPTGWATWSSPPYSESANPDVLWNQPTTLTIDLSEPVSTFGFETEPDPFALIPFTVTYKLSLGDVEVGQIVKSIDGFGGARLVALRALDDEQCFDKIEIVATADFALAQFRYALAPEGSWSISDDLTPQGVCEELPVAIKVHPTIWMDTDVDVLEYPCANPLTNSHVKMGFDWTIKSNVPWWKRIEATDLMTAYWFESFAMGEDGYPDGFEEVYLEDRIEAQRVQFTVDGAPVGNPWWSDVIGHADMHEETERVDYEVDINWCDTAGWYYGYVWLCAFQN